MKMENRFLWWIEERQNIYLKKEAGEPWPWTKDEILQTYKFTNAFRQQDAVTKELVKVLKKSDSKETLFTKIVIFRMFNWPPTYHVLQRAGLVDKWSVAKAIKILSRYQEDGNKIFTGAYMMTGSGSSGAGGKVKIVCETIGKMLRWKSSVVADIHGFNSLELATSLLTKFDMVGNFVAYEIVTDLRHTKVLNKACDIFTWANPGPGAKRGAHRILYNTPRGGLPAGMLINNTKVEKPDYQAFMQDLMCYAQNKIGMKLGVTFEMRDIEHSLCEFDKYMRVYNNEGRPRGKYNNAKHNS